jgi:oxygen-independent coproporphyrinogen-3 oxidase
MIYYRNNILAKVKMLLYLHIPFCDSKCHYCAFNSYTHLHHLKARYMDAIMVQLTAELERFNTKKGEIETLFIGGGTPSCLKASLYQPFFNTILPYLKENAEITTEANPNSATKSWLEQMHALGVNRMSFGVQSFDEKKLTFLNRNHTPAQAIEALKFAEKIGFKHISLDLIYGTCLDSKSLLKRDLDIAFSLPINHLSAYSLTIEEQTHFFTTPEASKDDEERAFWLINEIEKRGLPAYEISNFGQHHSKHNRGYWEYKDYIGVGSGAVGFLKDRRFYTQTDVNSYIKTPTDSRTELLDSAAIKEEKMLLGLRSIVGFEEDILSDGQRLKARHLLEANKLHYHDKRFYNKNFFLADELTLYLLS